MRTLSLLLLLSILNFGMPTQVLAQGADISCVDHYEQGDDSVIEIQSALESGTRGALPGREEHTFLSADGGVDADWVPLRAQPYVTYVIRATRHSQLHSENDLEPVLSLHDSDGALLNEAEFDGERLQAEIRLRHNGQEPALFYVQTTEKEGRFGCYRYFLEAFKAGAPRTQQTQQNEDTDATATAQPNNGTAAQPKGLWTRTNDRSLPIQGSPDQMETPTATATPTPERTQDPDSQPTPTPERTQDPDSQPTPTPTPGGGPEITVTECDIDPVTGKCQDDQGKANLPGKQKQDPSPKNPGPGQTKPLPVSKQDPDSENPETTSTPTPTPTPTPTQDGGPKITKKCTAAIVVDCQKNQGNTNPVTTPTPTSTPTLGGDRGGNTGPDCEDGDDDDDCQTNQGHGELLLLDPKSRNP